MSTIISNIQVFDGERFRGPKDVVIDSGIIVSICDSGTGSFSSLTTLDGTGKFLVAGFIDCHVHVREKAQLKAHARHGVTTVLDMGCWPATLADSLRNLASHADFLTAGQIAFAPDSRIGKDPVAAQMSPVVSVEDARLFVQNRVQEGANFIKCVLEGSFNPEVLQTLAHQAREAGKVSIAHVTDVPAFQKGHDAGFDVLTHAPASAVLPKDLAEKIQKAEQICVPTLVMMNAVMAKVRPGADRNCAASVHQMHQVGVPILVGTDSNEGKSGGPAEVLHGAMYRTEIVLLSQAGLSMVEILRAATVEAAKHFKLEDRGVIEIGKRGDLVVLGSDPLRDLAAYGRVEEVFCNGVRVS